MYSNRKILWPLFVLFFLSSGALANKEQVVEKKMYDAIQNSNIALFRELLDMGGNPTLPTREKKFSSTSLCASTLVGKEEFFDAILETDWPIDIVSEGSTFYGTVLSCAISNVNYPVYRKLVDFGFDVNVVLNPSAAKKFEKRPFTLTLGTAKLKFAWDMLQRIEPDDSQIAHLVRTVERPMIKGHPDFSYHKMLLEWLDERGVEYQQPLLIENEFPKPDQ